MKLFTLAEAAQFLRMSRSSLYQRKDIPRYRRPGSRAILFDEDELEAWLKQGRLGSVDKAALEKSQTTYQHNPKDASNVVDMSPQPVYHRNARYRQVT